MSDDHNSAEAPQTATALAEPPKPPRTPGLATGTVPPPKRRRWVGWVIGIVCLVLVVGALVGVVLWSLRRSAPPATAFSAYRAGFESAMRKVGTTATFPEAPVELTGVSATGDHSFEATLTADEVTALVNVFRWSTEIQGTSVSVSSTRIGFPSAGTASLRARVKVNDSSYSGTVEGPVQYESGAITSPGATKVVAEGLTVTGERAAQAPELLLVYLNGYLEAAPGLSVTSADVTGEGVHVEGNAPDTLVMP